MKYLLFTFLILFPFLGFAQSINNIPLSEIDSEYILLQGTKKALSNKVVINIQYGQQDKIWVGKDTQVRDENEKMVVFNSMIDALNFMSKYGYKFVDAYAVTTGSTNVYHWLMEKKITKQF